MGPGIDLTALIGIIVGGVIILTAIIAIIVFLCLKQKRQSKKVELTEPTPQAVKVFAAALPDDSDVKLDNNFENSYVESQLIVKSDGDMKADLEKQEEKPIDNVSGTLSARVDSKLNLVEDAIS